MGLSSMLFRDATGVLGMIRRAVGWWLLDLSAPLPDFLKKLFGARSRNNLAPLE